MTTIPPEAIQAAAEALADWFGHDGDIKVPNAEVDREMARVVLKAAEAVWPHTPPVRSPESTVAAVTDRAPSPSFRRPPARPARPFGFGPGADA